MPPALYELEEANGAGIRGRRGKRRFQAYKLRGIRWKRKRNPERSKKRECGKKSEKEPR
jgi:hypothetical protein